MAPTVPAPRAPLGGRRPGGAPVARWYEQELGWATAGGSPVRLPTGLRFDVLDLPAAAGLAVLRRVPGDWPVAVAGERARILVAAGSAGEVPGLLDWLEWGGIGLDLAAWGAGGLMAAPAPPGWDAPGTGVWVRPPEPGREVETTLAALPGAAGPPDGSGLVRLVAAAAVECHRAGLLAAGAAGRARSRGAARG